MSLYGPPPTTEELQRAYLAELDRLPATNQDAIGDIRRAIRSGIAQPVIQDGRIVGWHVAKNPDGLRPVTAMPSSVSGQGVGSWTQGQGAAQGPGGGALIPGLPTSTWDWQKNPGNPTASGSTATQKGTTTSNQSGSSSSNTASTTNMSSNVQTGSTMQQSGATTTSSSALQTGSTQSQATTQQLSGGATTGAQTSQAVAYSGASPQQAALREQLRQLALTQLAGTSAGVIAPYSKTEIAQQAGLNADMLAKQYAAEAYRLRKQAAAAGVSQDDAAWHDAAREVASRRLDSIMEALRQAQMRGTEANWAARQSATQALAGMQFAQGQAQAAQTLGQQQGQQIGAQQQTGTTQQQTQQFGTTSQNLSQQQTGFTNQTGVTQQNTASNQSFQNTGTTNTESSTSVPQQWFQPQAKPVTFGGGRIDGFLDGPWPFAQGVPPNYGQEEKPQKKPMLLPPSEPKR
ncbi:MAG: hypothetical protein N2690_05115 [Rhodocyclaceae bacterium]|nr:hypothetical protein [Rhodocyclaceae bacterium]